MNKDNSVALSLYCIYWSDKETNPQSSNPKDCRQTPKPWDQFSCNWVKSTWAREPEPIHQPVCRNVINLIHSIAILTALALTQGTNANAKMSKAPRMEKYPVISRPIPLEYTAPAPKINTGV